jgi:hypothetical protein
MGESFSSDGIYLFPTITIGSAAKKVPDPSRHAETHKKQGDRPPDPFFPKRSMSHLRDLRDAVSRFCNSFRAAVVWAAQTG